MMILSVGGKLSKMFTPRLSKLARKYLACPPTSVPSERVFINAGLIYNKKRNRLSAEKAEKLMFIKHILPIFELQYLCKKYIIHCKICFIKVGGWGKRLVGCI